MIEYKDFAPTPFDHKGLYLEDRQDWLVANVSHTRDSHNMDESNFQAYLNELGGESDSVEVHRFGHWGPGWFEIILIDPKAKGLVAIAEQLDERLANYPILDEDDYYTREFDAINEAWQSWGISELEEIATECLGLAEYETRIAWHTTKLLEECDEYMISEDGGCYLNTKELTIWLNKLPLWFYVGSIALTKEAWDSLSDKDYHQILSLDIAVEDIETNEPLAIPDYISPIPDKRQIPLLG